MPAKIHFYFESAKKNEKIIKKKSGLTFRLIHSFVIPLGFEPKTHSLEGCCSNPTELRNQHCHFSLASAKVILFGESTKYFGIFFSFISILRKFFIARASSSIIFKAFALTGRRAKTTKNPGCYPGDV